MKMSGTRHDSSRHKFVKGVVAAGAAEDP